ncbi:leukocyte receptor cluster member 9-like [Ylistrum balloti]|uniref:leukocyte receptor cluster member 9-like n=1 Tax=Ylistrum balloti TaxID=509963 RepID=UPI002905B1E1|nr:leukocyte receptor cluster member 9-like [Ylistrum balloti]
MAAAGSSSETTETSQKVEENSDVQQLEINTVKQTFTGQCRVLTNIGEHRHIVTLVPKDKDLVIKFQLTANYPNDAPGILIKSAVLDEEEVTSLQNHLQERAEQMKGAGIILVLAAEAQTWLEDQGIIIEERIQENNSKKTNRYNTKGSGEKQKRKKRKEQIEEKETENVKKAAMKTAEDVIKRIQWDGQLPQDEFIVGYIDRFTGIQEKYFDSFSWEDIASVDYTVLAIPKHRIQYFKYRDIKIWDKNDRLDNVFGSLGSKITVYDVIKQCKEEEKAAKTNADGKEDVDDDDDEEDDDSDSDDGITVSLGASADPTGEGNNFEDDNMSDDEEGYDKYWRDKMRPNHFVALRISNEDIRNTAEDIQNIILEHEPQYHECCIPPNALHITLCTLGLDTPEQVANAVRAMKKIKPELETIVPKDKPIVMKGIEQFFNRVLYAKVECPPEFYQFVEHLKLCLKEEGIDIRDNHDFVPHMTVMKITRPVARATGKKYISPWLYSGQAEVDFGTQVVDNVHLCEMGFGRQDDGFYMTPASIDW